MGTLNECKTYLESLLNDNVYVTVRDESNSSKMRKLGEIIVKQRLY